MSGQVSYHGRRSALLLLACGFIAGGATSRANDVPTHTGVVGQVGADLDRANAAKYGLMIEPIVGLTTVNHLAPQRFSVPVGTSLRLIQRAPVNGMVAWEGAYEVQRTANGSIGEVVADEVGTHFIRTTVSRRGVQAWTNSVVVDVVSTSLDDIRLGVVNVVAEQRSGGGNAVDENPDGSPLWQDGENQYITPVNQGLALSVTVDPPAFGSLVEWRVDGYQPNLGLSVTVDFGEPGLHRAVVGPIGLSAAVDIRSFQTSISSHVSGEDLVSDNERVTFEAVTTPPGYEEFVRWHATTENGTVEPSRGQGARFTVQFSDTFVASGRAIVTCQVLKIGANDGLFVQERCKPKEPILAILPGQDCWVTPCGSTIYDCCQTPIFAGFFGPGSAVFNDIIPLGAPSAGGGQDTIINRFDSLDFLNLNETKQTAIELGALALESCGPITVDWDNQPSNLWDVAVYLSSTVPPMGTMSVTLTHTNGGTFTSSFFVQPVFEFTSVDDPSIVLTYDTAEWGIPPMELFTVGGPPWVSVAEPGNEGCSPDFAPGVVEGSGGRAHQCCVPVGHSGPGHLHQTGQTCSPCPMGACCMQDGTCQVEHAVDCGNLGGVYMGDGTDCTDTDGDRIADVFETNDCCGPRDLCHTGSDPNNPDTDGDGIADGDEMYGTTAGLNLPAMGADVCHKDIFVEADWTDDSLGGFHSHRLTAGADARIVAAFAASPVPNPDGATGINLHSDYGQGGAFTGGNLIPGSPSFIVFDSGFNALKAVHFAANRKGYFHYAIFSHAYNFAGNGSSGIAEINADDFMVTLGNFGSDYNVSQTYMHELGHNLNLRHGGNVNLNYKPNYNSVMNYRFQFPGIDGVDCNSCGNGILDYSIGGRLTLNENALVEAVGVCGAPGIDWNQSGGISGTVVRNINCVCGTTTNCGVACQVAGPCSVISDFNDWANIVYNNLFGGDRAVIEIVECEAIPER